VYETIVIVDPSVDILCLSLGTLEIGGTETAEYCRWKTNYTV